MYSNSLGGLVPTQAECGSSSNKDSPTLSQNIDRRIIEMQRQIQRLEYVKQQLVKPGGILEIPIDDLRFAMNY